MVEGVDVADIKPPHAWDIQPGESTRDYYRFCEFKDLGPTRTLTKLAEKLGMSSMLGQLSRSFDWDERARAYDLYMKDLFQKQVEETVKEEAIKTGKMISTLKDVILHDAIALKYQADDPDRGEGEPVMNQRNMVQLAQAIVSMERLHNEQPTEIIKDDGPRQVIHKIYEVKPEDLKELEDGSRTKPSV